MNEELKVIISAEIGELKKGIADAKGEIDKFAKNGVSGFDQFNNAVTSMGQKSTALLKGTATAVAGLGSAMLALGPLTEEYRTGQAKLNAAFETAGASAETAKGVYNDLYRVLGDSDVSVEAANHLAELTTNQEDLADWTEICQGVYAKFGDSLPIEGLTEAANETAKTGSLTGSLADALNWAGQSEDEFQEKLDACVSASEREALIRETLIDVYDDAAAAYEENAAGIIANNEAQAALDESLASIGETMGPVMTMLKELGAEILADLAPYIKDFAENNLPKIAEALSGVGEKVGAVITWLADNWEIVATIGGIVLAIAAAISVLSTGLGIYNTVMGITAVVSAPIAGIILAIVAGVIALGVAIVAVVKNWDTIKEAAGKAINAISDGVKKMAEAVVNFFKDMFSKISETVGKIKDAVVNKFNEVKNGISEKVNSAKTAVSETFSGIKEKMTSTMEEAKKNIQQKLDSVKQAYEKNGGGIKGVVAATMEGVKQYYKTGYDAINTLTNGKFGEIVNTIKSKMEGVVTSISNILGNIKSKFTSAFETVKNTVSKAVSALKSMFNFEWKLPKIKLPHFKISGKFSLDPPSIPKISVSWYQKGGIFDKPTLFGYAGGIGGLGENGAEAIVPLEKNTEWLDRIADRLAARDGNASIVLQVDGKTFAQTSIASINALTRQTGSLPLQIV